LCTWRRRALRRKADSEKRDSPPPVRSW
jgi:hypothetical protein